MVGGTPLTNTEVEDETDTTTTGTVSPSVLSHAVDVHESQFVRDAASTTGTLTSGTYSVTTLAVDRPVRFAEGSLVLFHAPTYTGFESNSARIHINVGEAGASDDVTANIRQLDGGGSHSIGVTSKRVGTTWWRTWVASSGRSTSRSKPITRWMNALRLHWLLRLRETPNRE